MHGTRTRVGQAFFLLGVTLTFTLGSSAQTEKILYSFTQGTDGFLPQAGLVSDGKGTSMGALSPVEQGVRGWFLN